MSRSLSQWLVENAGLISMIGALVIFFSWAVTNTLGQRYSRLKQAVETADGTFRLYTSLHELRDSLNSVAMEAVYAKEAVEKVSRETNDHGVSETTDLRRQFSHTRMSAHQVKELMDFAAQSLNYSSSVADATPTSSRIQSLNNEIYTVYSKVIELERAVALVNAASNPSLEPLRDRVEAYVSYVRDEAIPKVPSLYAAIVASSNTRHNEGRTELDQAKRKAGYAARTALVLYVLGSLLALGGQFLDKVYKQRSGTSATSAIPASRAASIAADRFNDV